jgi:hypothetical protein
MRLNVMLKAGLELSGLFVDGVNSPLDAALSLPDRDGRAKIGLCTTRTATTCRQWLPQ